MAEILRLDGNVRDACALHMMMLEQVDAARPSSTSSISTSTIFRFVFSRQSIPFVTTLHGG
jgi:hypothetical protein